MPASFATPALLAWIALSDPAPSEHLPLPPAREGIVFAADTTKVSLDRLLAELARATGQELAMERSLLDALKDMRVPLRSTDPVPAERVYTFVESHLATHGVRIAPLKAGERPVLGVEQWGSSSGSRHLQPVAVSIAQMDEAAGHPALLVCLPLTIGHVDPRRLPKDLRPLLADPEAGETWAYPVGGRSLLLVGRGSRVVEIARQVLAMDEAAGRAEQEPPASEGGQ